MKPIVFLGDSLARLRGFPESARQDTGRELARVQAGNVPLDWNPMPTVGRGVREIRVSDKPGEFRILYVAQLADAIYVLHAFHKKTQKTAQRDVDLAASRYQQI
ncbi:MAG: type II toxin-antitoxin system RelE/ParE family toxin [Candidatus Omnitrophota bacterium]|nr:type II toxin-antitoxin system RelE/ParE family toxin [Candidatus Omnitrophota bacterium]